MQWVDADEQIGVFTQTRRSPGTGSVVSSQAEIHAQTTGADASSWAANYGFGSEEVEGIIIQGGGMGIDAAQGAATVVVVTQPATDLILQYDGLGAQKHGVFRIGRVVSDSHCRGPRDFV